MTCHSGILPLTCGHTTSEIWRKLKQQISTGRACVWMRRQLHAAGYLSCKISVKEKDIEVLGLNEAGKISGFSVQTQSWYYSEKLWAYPAQCLFISTVTLKDLEAGVLNLSFLLFCFPLWVEVQLFHTDHCC